jgi:hypothetical protein
VDSPALRLSIELWERDVDIYLTTSWFDCKAYYYGDGVKTFEAEGAWAEWPRSFDPPASDCLAEGIWEFARAVDGGQTRLSLSYFPLDMKPHISRSVLWLSNKTKVWHTLTKKDNLVPPTKRRAAADKTSKQWKCPSVVGVRRPTAEEGKNHIHIHDHLLSNN